ncbi:unnamed protein product, partial [Cercopithifilaria johnstoni]
MFLAEILTPTTEVEQSEISNIVSEAEGEEESNLYTTAVTTVVSEIRQVISRNSHMKKVTKEFGEFEDPEVHNTDNVEDVIEHDDMEDVVEHNNMKSVVGRDNVKNITA